MTLTEHLDEIDNAYQDNLTDGSTAVMVRAQHMRYLLAVARAADKLETALEDAGHYGEEDEAKTCVQCAALAEFCRVAESK